MGSYFFDSSGVVKRYVAEVGSAWVLGITDPLVANDIYVVHVTGVEVVSAWVRKQPSLPLPDLADAIAEFKHDLQRRYQRVAVTGVLIGRAMSLAEAHRLRGYDAVQLQVPFRCWSRVERGVRRFSSYLQMPT